MGGSSPERFIPGAVTRIRCRPSYSPTLRSSRRGSWRAGGGRVFALGILPAHARASSGPRDGRKLSLPPIAAVALSRSNGNESMTSNSEMRCRSCAYDLRELSENRCPECGCEFDPADSGTYLTRPYDDRRLFIIAVCSFAGAAVGPAAALASRAGWLDWNSWIGTLFYPVYLVLMLGGVGLSGGVAWSAFQVFRGHSPWVVRPDRVRLAFGIAMTAIALFVAYIVVTGVLRLV